MEQERTTAKPQENRVQFRHRYTIEQLLTSRLANHPQKVHFETVYPNPHPDD